MKLCARRVKVFCIDHRDQKLKDQANMKEEENTKWVSLLSEVS